MEGFVAATVEEIRCEFKDKVAGNPGKREFTESVSIKVSPSNFGSCLKSKMFQGKT